MAISVKTKDQLVKGLKKFQPIIKKAKAADINESDTVTIIVDMLSDVFGYDKYAEITSEYAIKKTFCDLAIKLNDKPVLLIECKAIGLELKDDFVRQATNYAADSGIEWVVLTNAVTWRMYKVIFNKPIEKELVYEFDMTELSPKKQMDIDLLYTLCRDSFTGSKKQSSLEDLYMQKQIVNKFMIGQLLLSDNMLDQLRKQIKRLAPDMKPDNDMLKSILLNDVIKREVCEGDQSADAKKRIAKMERDAAKAKAAKAKPTEE